MTATVFASIRRRTSCLLACVAIALVYQSPVLAQPAERAKDRVVAAIPDVCRRDDGKRVDECPQTCAAACESSSFNRGPVIAAACDRLMVRKGQQDAPACREAVATATHAALVAQCNREVPGVGESSIIPNANRPPHQCFRSFKNMECRFRGLAMRGATFTSTIDQLTKGEYGTRQGADMCKIEKTVVERDYTTANQVQDPIAKFSSDFNIEYDCLNKFRTWLNDAERGFVCPADDRVCDARKQEIRRQIAKQLEGSISMSTQVSGSLQTARKTVEDIRGFWQTYSILCF